MHALQINLRILKIVSSNRLNASEVTEVCSLSGQPPGFFENIIKKNFEIFQFETVNFDVKLVLSSSSVCTIKYRTLLFSRPLLLGSYFMYGPISDEQLTGIIDYILIQARRTKAHTFTIFQALLVPRSFPSAYTAILSSTCT